MGWQWGGVINCIQHLLLLLKLELVEFFFSEFLISVSPTERLWQATPFLAPKNFFLSMVKYTNRLHQFILQLFSTSVFSVLNFALQKILLFLCLFPLKTSWPGSVVEMEEHNSNMLTETAEVLGWTEKLQTKEKLSLFSLKLRWNLMDWHWRLHSGLCHTGTWRAVPRTRVCTVHTHTASQFNACSSAGVT